MDEEKPACLPEEDLVDVMRDVAAELEIYRKISDSGRPVTGLLRTRMRETLGRALELRDRAQRAEDALRVKSVDLVGQMSAISRNFEIQDRNHGCGPDDRTVDSNRRVAPPSFMGSGNWASRMAEIAEREDGKLFSKFYPRIYPNLGQYHSPKIIAGALCNMVDELHMLGINKLGTAMKIMLPALDYLVDRRMPTFFIAPELLEAVKRSDFDGEINWKDLKLPFEHGAFVLPRGGFSHPEDGEVCCIFWSRVESGEYPCKVGRVSGLLRMGVGSLGLVALTTNAVFYDSNLTTEVRPTIKLRNLFYKYEGGAPDNSTGLLDEALRPQDEGFISDLGCVVFGTFLAMLARPQLLSLGKLDKAVAPKGSKPRKEFWTPNIIGRDYRLPRRDDMGGTHSTPRMHWRRGHFRQQPYGIGMRSLRPDERSHRTVWIEPSLIAAEKKKDG